MKKILLLSLVGFLISANALATSPTIYNGPVRIDSVTPTSGPTGTEVIVRGVGFSTQGNWINFAGAPRALQADSADSKTLRFRIPATPCEFGKGCDEVELRDGRYPLSITTGYDMTSNEVFFTVTSRNSLPSPIEQGLLEMTLSFTVSDAHTGIFLKNASITIYSNGAIIGMPLIQKNDMGIVWKNRKKPDFIEVSAPSYQTRRVDFSEIVEGKINMIGLLKNGTAPFIAQEEATNTATVTQMIQEEIKSNLGFWARLFRFLFGRFS